jgi:hypothetical protein
MRGGRINSPQGAAGTKRDASTNEEPASGARPVGGKMMTTGQGILATLHQQQPVGHEGTAGHSGQAGPLMRRFARQIAADGCSVQESLLALSQQESLWAL